MEDNQSLMFLWNRYASGDDSAFEQIFELYYPMLFSFALGILKQPDLAENAVADAFTKIIEYPEKSKIETPESWFFTITRNHCLSYWRKRNRRAGILNNIRSQFESNVYPDAEFTLDKSLITNLLESRLNKRDFAIWELSNQGYDNAEIAEALGITKKTVGNRKSLIKTDLTALIAELENNQTNNGNNE